eukprot:COSAG06_NODE_1851_length_8215_cov_39.893790_1_plen_63_part_00
MTHEKHVMGGGGGGGPGPPPGRARGWRKKGFGGNVFWAVGAPGGAAGAPRGPLLAPPGPPLF